MITRWERYISDEENITIREYDEGDWVLFFTRIIEDAFDDLAEQECPYCHRQLDLPSLEDIQEWLKEEK